MSDAKHIPIEELRELPEATPRQRINGSRVAEFARLYTDEVKRDTWNPDALPALTVVVSDGEIILADGRHRLAALRKIGAEFAPVVLIPPREDPTAGSDRERALRTAYMVALETAAREGLPLNATERLDACRELRRLGLSVESTALRVGVSRRTVIRATRPTVTDVTQGGGYPADADVDTLMRRLVSGLAAAWDAKGVTEGWLTADRGGARLADALEAKHGSKKGAAWARRLRQWAAEAERRLSTAVKS